MTTDPASLVPVRERMHIPGRPGLVLGGTDDPLPAPPAPAVEPEPVVGEEKPAPRRRSKGDDGKDAD